MNTRFTALEIGSGDAFLLEDAGKTILFDSGGSKSKIVSLLKKRGIEKLDLAICSHNDKDHANGFLGLLNSSIKIKEIWLPSTIASIADYLSSNSINIKEIAYLYGTFDEAYLGNLSPKSLFSNNYKSTTHRELKTIFSDLAERINFEKKPLASYRSKVHYARHLAELITDHKAHEIFRVKSKETPTRNRYYKYKKLYLQIVYRLAYMISVNIADHLFNDFFVLKDTRIINHSVYQEVYSIVNNVIDEIVDLCGIKNVIKYYKELYFEIDRTIDDYLDECQGHDLKERLSKFCCYLDYFLPESELENDILIKIDRIIEIANLAYKRNCTIKWFEPIHGCTKYHKRRSNFIALNSTLKRQVNSIKDQQAFAFALFLTEVNQYSLVFEYCDKESPIIRFSADSDCTCQSTLYNGAIVTAPHHGSEANAIVYKQLKGDNIIWVRSDALNKTQGRPCGMFKSRKKNKKYCLACKHRTPNKKREVCFEYDNLIQQWRLIHGYSCIC